MRLETGRLYKRIWGGRSGFKASDVHRAELLLGVTVGSEESVLRRGVEDLSKVDKVGGKGGWRGWGGWRRQREWESGKRRRGVE